MARSALQSAHEIALAVIFITDAVVGRAPRGGAGGSGLRNKAKNAKARTAEPAPASPRTTKPARPPKQPLPKSQAAPGGKSTSKAITNTERAAVAALQQELTAIFTNRRLRTAQWGVAVYSLDKGASLFEHNADKLYVPASNQKILTAAVALARLGPEYRFKTQVWACGAISDGVFRGDLIIKGGGDPSASQRVSGPNNNHTEAGESDRNYQAAFAAFTNWAARLKQLGITAIAGNLRGDATAFSGPPYGQGWEWDDLIAGYAAPISALAFNENMASLVITPGSQSGAAPNITQEPLPDYLRLENHSVTTGNNAAVGLRFARGNRRERDDTVAPTPLTTTAADEAVGPAGTVIKISGALPLQSQPIRQSIAVSTPTHYYLAALRAQLAAQGIDVTDCAIKEMGEMAPDYTNARLLWTHESKPLGELLVPIMKQSLNIPAEALLRVIGMTTRGVGSATDGIITVGETLKNMGIGKDSYVYADASGLSRRNLASAAMLVRVLRYMYRQPSFQCFYDSLAIGGTDGTLKNRLRESGVKGNVHAKTGTISGVSAISGYLRTADGEMLAFAMIANNYPGSRSAAAEAQNRALARLAAFSRLAPARIRSTPRTDTP